MLTNELFNTDYERRLNEGAVDQLEQRRIDDLNMKMDELANRVKSTSNPEHKKSLLKAFLDCKAERDSYYKIKEGEVTRTATGIKHRSTDAYGGTPKEKDPLAKLDKATTNSLEKGMGVRFDREKKYQGGLDIDEAGIGHDIANKSEKMARATPPTRAGAVASTVKNAAKWLAGKGGPGKEGPTYEGAEDIEDRGEYDREGDMVKDNLHTIRREAERLEKILVDNENVPEWVQDKLAQVKGMLTASSEYMQTQRERDHEEQSGEEGVTIAEWTKEGPWTKIPKTKSGKPVDPRGEVAHLSDVARRETERKVQPQKKNSEKVAEHGGGVANMKSYIAWRKKANTEHGITKEDENPLTHKELEKLIAQAKAKPGQTFPELHRGEEHEINGDQDRVEEGWQDFNKVEPYAVCLAGKPVKKFDYYEQARKFHDNWKQKLYREGDKAKADKITLMPLNLDEGDRFNDPMGYNAATSKAAMMMGYNRFMDVPNSEIDKVHALADKIQKEKHRTMHEAGSPAQQAAIAIAMKKAHKKPKQVDEDYGSWIVYDPETKQIKKRFKTHTAGKSYAKTHGLGFASSEYYFDNVKEKAVDEETTRLDPKCWKGKKIGNPKTKVKGGVRVNNCVPAEESYTGVMESQGVTDPTLLEVARRIDLFAKTIK